MYQPEQDILSTFPHPFQAFSRSAMDGYAVRAADTTGASESQPVVLNMFGEISMGQQADIALGSSRAALTHTGVMLSANYFSVVTIEFSKADQNGKIKVFRPVMPRENTIELSEDVSSDRYKLMIVRNDRKKMIPTHIHLVMDFLE